MKVMNAAVILGKVFVYSFTALLMLIGLISVISTISANVHMRAGEFAFLQSAGMTRGGLKRMLDSERVMCSAKSLMTGLPASVLLTYLINLPVQAVFPIPCSLPRSAAAQYSIMILIKTWITMRCSASKLYGRNTAQTICSER